MLAIVGSVTSVSLMEKKGASSTQASVQAYQVADSGVQFAIRKINARISAGGGTIEEAFGSGSCNSGKIPTNADGGPIGSNYELTFYDSSDAKIIDCNAQVSSINSIGSVGTYDGAVRAVNVAVAAGGDYQSVYVDTDGDLVFLCKINTTTGVVGCKAKEDVTNSVPWYTCKSPWSSPTSGNYSLDCVYVNPGNGFSCCRTNADTGTIECKYSKSFFGGACKMYSPDADWMSITPSP